MRASINITRSRTADPAATRAARRGGGARRDRTAVGTLPPVSFLLECNVWNVPSKTPAFSSYSAARAALEQHTRCKHCHGAIALKQQDV